MSIDYAVRAIAQVTGAPSPATSGTSLGVSTGQGARFPTVTAPELRRARLYKVSDGTVEIITYVHSAASDTFTITRNVDSAGAATVANTGWVLEDIDDLGGWHAVAYDSGFFAAVGGGTWTVDSGDVLTQRWRRIGFTIEYEVAIATSSISGTVSSLKILLPTAAASAVASRSGPHPCIIFDNSGTVAVLGYVSILSATNEFLIFKADGTNFTASTNNTIVSIMVKVQIS